LLCMADKPLAFFFGGALCFYFAGGEKSARLLVPFFVILAALTNIKDMGLALALVAWFVVMVDLFFCERDRMAFVVLRRAKSFWMAFAAGLVCIAGAYLVWAFHLNTPAVGINRFDLGSGGQSLPMLDMLLMGFKALFGIEPSAQFSQALPRMLNAFFTRPISLLGPCVAVLAVILVLTLAALVLSPTRRRRRRVLLFTLAMALGFAAFYLFNIFTYAFIFKGGEAEHLKDYDRYISPYFVGWLMGVLVLLSHTANNEKAVYMRLRTARVASVLAALFLVAVVLLRGNWHGSFLNISPSFYTQRLNVRSVAGIAQAEGLDPQDTVYLVSQGDDGTRFYMFGFELPAVRVPTYAGPLAQQEGDAMRYAGNAGGTLAEANDGLLVACTPQQLAEYLAQEGCTHLLLDELDDYFLEVFAPLFSDELAGWTNDASLGRGHRYYRVLADEAGGCLLVPEEGGAS
ncbi:MAG: hypothetical protein AB7V55_00160, partial [Oscillospiraceae bacterium]